MVAKVARLGALLFLVASCRSSAMTAGGPGAAPVGDGGDDGVADALPDPAEASAEVLAGGGTGDIAEYESCDVQDDLCRPGTICMPEAPGNSPCGSHCYRLCQTDRDCPGTRCSVLLGKGGIIHKLCSKPTEPCEPIAPARCSAGTARPYPTFGCYVMAPDAPDLRTCACAGSIPIGAPCKFQGDCAPGAECGLYAGQLLCRRVCKIRAAAGTPLELGGCPAEAPSCTPFAGAFTYGYCH